MASAFSQEISFSDVSGTPFFLLCFLLRSFAGCPVSCNGVVDIWVVMIDGDWVGVDGMDGNDGLAIMLSSDSWEIVWI